MTENGAESSGTQLATAWDRQELLKSVEKHRDERIAYLQSQFDAGTYPSKSLKDFFDAREEVSDDLEAQHPDTRKRQDELGWSLDKPHILDGVARYRSAEADGHTRTPRGVIDISGEVPEIAHTWSTGDRSTLATLHDLVDFPEIAECWKVDLMDPEVEPDHVIRMQSVLRTNAAFAAAVIDGIAEHHRRHNGEDPLPLVREQIVEAAVAESHPVPDYFWKDFG